MRITRQELLTKAIEHGASEVTQWWINAAGDIAFDFDPGCYCSGSNLAKVYKELEKDGLDKYAIKDAMADHIYDDVDSIVDCTGDRLYDEAMQIQSNPAGFAKHLCFDVIFIMLCEEVKQKSSGNIVKAMDKMIVDHRERLEKKKVTS